MVLAIAKLLTNCGKGNYSKLALVNKAIRILLLMSLIAMQLIFDQSTSTVWLFATPNELLQIAAMAQQKITEARLGQSSTIFEKNIDRSNLLLRISANKDSDIELK